jgi:hypothetical protein
LKRTLLDYLQKSKQHFLLEIAKDEGLKGVTNYVKSISIASWKKMLREMGILEGKNVIIRDTQAILTGWYEINEMKNPAARSIARYHLIWKIKESIENLRSLVARA